MTVSTVTAPTSTDVAVSSSAAVPTSPQLAEGVELLGRYKGSGFKEPRYLVRRADGQVVQLPSLLYHVAEGIGEGLDYAEIGDRVGEAINRTVSAQNVEFVIDEKLRPIGVVANADGAPPSSPKPESLLALKYKGALIPPSGVRILAALFMPFFITPVVIAVLGATIVLDIWLFTSHGLGEGLRAALYEPTTLLLILGLIVVSAVFHECGHAAATRYGGAQPGAMGAGLYIVWPALYTDITDAYRLGRAGRLRADLGGVYFNTIFMLLTAGAYFLTGFEPLLLVIPLQHLEIAHQLLPLLRLDGYYIVSDLTGVPDILSRIKPTLKSLVPGVETDPRVRELKPWARAVVTVYVVLLVPMLLFLFSMMALAAPRIFATAWDALGLTWQRAHAAIDYRDAIASLMSVIQLAVLALSPIGLGLTLASAGRRLSGAVWRGTETRPRARVMLVASSSAALTALFLSWWTNGAYRAVAAGERGTLSARVFDIRAAVGRGSHHRLVPSRRPSEPRDDSRRPPARHGPTTNPVDPGTQGGPMGSESAPAQQRPGSTRSGTTTTPQEPAGPALPWTTEGPTSTYDETTQETGTSTETDTTPAPTTTTP